MRAEVSGQLNRRHTDAARRTVDRYPFAGPEIRAPKESPYGHASKAQRRGFLMGEVLRLVSQKTIVSHAQIFRVGPHRGTGKPEHVIADVEPGDLRASGCDASREFG